VVIWSAQVGGASLMMVAVGLAVVAMGAAAVLLFPRYQAIFAMVPPGIFGLLYIPVSLGFLVAIREAADGAYWIFFIICMVFLNDIAAFYCGTQFGKRKLWPAVSPGKTIEGSLGGLAACLVAGVIFQTVFLGHLPIGETLLFILSIGVAGPAGDLFESVLKRTHGVKDSGGIMPGHGGLLDRIDALLFAAPVAYVFRFYVFT
jgi:phosphatidate cytidylyltransferase